VISGFRLDTARGKLMAGIIKIFWREKLMRSRQTKPQPLRNSLVSIKPKLFIVFHFLIYGVLLAVIVIVKF
jgi:hypothetical protein